MHKNYFQKLLLLFFMLIGFSTSAQDIMDVGPENVNRLKLEGKLTGKERYTYSKSQPGNWKVSAPSNTPQASTACNCWIPRDNTWQIGQFDGSGASGGPGMPPDYRNDDWATIAIPIPFNFCFYGRQITEFFLNNNGNISFDTAYSTFTANSFPDSTFKMIAPFWADVDTRGLLSGLVYYKIEPTHVIIHWENVGYFSTQDDKLNSFQLIITNGNDPILGNNRNVAFCYQDMQWTTGSASSGINGFGGFPATVGVNQGNGANYIQFGLFDSSGAAYDGPYGFNDGVDWLDNQSFNFNVCVSSFNIPPVLNSLSVCDTIRVCENSVFRITANYLSPEPTESTSINYFFAGMQGITVVSNTPGNTASLILDIAGQTSNLGFHTISITAIDNGSPAGSTNNNIVIEVIPAPAPSFTYLPASPIAPGTTVTFTNTTPPGSLATWDFGDGSPIDTTQNPQHTYTTAGTYTVTLTAESPLAGCITTVTQQVTVVLCASATFTVTNVCAGTPSLITYTGSASAAATFTWDFNGGSVISGSGSGPYTVSWNTPGTYTPVLTVTEPICAASDSVSVTVYAIPLSSVSPLASLCAGDSPTVSFNGTAGAGATYTWNFGTAAVLSGTGAGPYNLQWNTAGSDQVSLIVSENGCSDTSQINVTINPIPTANFSIPATACSNEILNVNYSGSASTTASYTWNFNGATISSGSGQGPYDVSWNAGGNYNVILNVTENGCNSAPFNLPVVVTQAPVVTISPVASLCEGDNSAVSFTGTAGAAAAYQWNFGSGVVVSGSGQGPYTVQWNSAGQDQVHLEVNENGCIDSSLVDVLIYPIPTSNFVINNAACVNQPVSLSYSGTATAAGTFNWSFSGGTVSSGSGQGPYSIVWNTPGSYQISLTVTEDGCVSAQTDLMATVNQIPAVFPGSYQAVCSGVPASIGNAAVAGETYSWSPAISLSDPTISNPVATPVNNSNATTSQNYTLTVTDANGCQNSDTVSVAAYPVPAIRYTKPASQCIENNSFSFSALSNINSGVNYQWSLTPQASLISSISQNITVSYSATGTFPVMLAADYNGCIAQPFTDSVTIYEMPTSEFSSTVRNGCVPLTVPFTNLSLGSQNSYTWNFGDGQNDQAANPVHTYNTPGMYTVSLASITENGCRADSSIKNYIEVYALPVGRFEPNPQVADILSPVIQFQNYSSNVATYIWNLGDSTSSTTWSPSHMYSDTGTYDITLMLVSPKGCVDTVRGIVKVEQHFSFYVPNAFTPNGDGVNDYFKGYGVAINKYLLNIYDRWGKLIYTTDDYDKPWDGRVNNNVVQNDVYVYRIALTDLHNEKHTYVGNVSVVK